MRLEPRERKIVKSVNLPPRIWDFVREVGGGEYAAGIRYLLELAYKEYAQEKTTLPRGNSEFIQN